MSNNYEHISFSLKDLHDFEILVVEFGRHFECTLRPQTIGVWPNPKSKQFRDPSNQPVLSGSQELVPTLNLEPTLVKHKHFTSSQHT